MRHLQTTIFSATSAFVASLLLTPASASTAIGPMPQVTQPTPVATASSVQPVRYAGRLLDVAHGYCFFSNGDAYKLDPAAAIVDQKTGRALQADDNLTSRYALATFASNGSVTQLAVADTPFAPQNTPTDVHTFAVSASAPKANPDLIDHHNGYTGEPVLVIFTVEVPPTTALTDSIFLSTEASGWDPMAMKMDRIDALHFRITRTLASGTKFVYRYTRGTWRSAERQENGLEGAPRAYTVQNLDVARRRDVVYHWSDENPSGGNLPGPDSVPTPQSGRPFQFTQ
jgi:hypothetical protein